MAKESPLKATVRPLDLPQHQIQVSVEVPGDAAEKGAVLALPAWTPGSYLVRDYTRFLDRVEAKDAGGKPVAVEKLDKQRWRLAPAKGPVTFSYRIYGNELTVRTNHIDASHAHLAPAATFVYLEQDLARPYEVRFENLPKGWKVATGLPGKDGAYAAKDYDTLVDSPFELGTFRLHTFEAMGAHFEFAMTGEHNGDEARIVEATKKIVEASGRIFGGFPFDRYVFLLTFSPKAGGGLEHKNSTALLSDPFRFEKAEGYHGLYELIAHEFFHVWNVKHMHDPVLGPFDYSGENYTRQLWFHEGFTSYMEHVIVLKAGVVPWAYVAKQMGTTWTENLQRPGWAEQGLEESSWDAWIRYYKPTEFSANSTVGYYDKGELTGWLMDAEIRSGSGGAKGLEDLFALLWHRVGEKGLKDADIRAAYKELSGKDPQPFWDAWILGRRPLDPAPVEKAFGLKLESKAPWELLPPDDQKDADAVARAKAYTGALFAKASPAGDPATLANVIPGSPADLAGLAHGMEVLAVNGWRTPTGSEAQRRLADAGVGGRAQVLAADRSRVSTFEVAVAENPFRTVRVTADPQATEAQKAAFKAWTGQELPSAPGVARTTAKVAAKPVGAQ